jgi:hypothetical protein
MAPNCVIVAGRMLPTPPRVKPTKWLVACGLSLHDSAASLASTASRSRLPPPLAPNLEGRTRLGIGLVGGAAEGTHAEVRQIFKAFPLIAGTVVNYLSIFHSSDCNMSIYYLILRRREGP